MPTFKSISKSNKPNNSIVNYAINDVNTVAKEDKCVKGCYVANPKYIYSGTPEDYVNDCFELQTKGILVLT